MSKRSEEKEKLARKLADGLISRAAYDERMARMKSGGHPNRPALAQRKARRASEPREWQPQAKATPAPEMHTLSVKVDDLTFRRIMRAMVVAGIEDIGQALGKLLETLPPEK